MLDAKTRELVAVAASVAGACHDCLRQHVAEGRRRGASDAEIREALEIGQAVRLTVSLNTDALAESLLGSPDRVAATADCGCGADCSCHQEA
jgi:AhpD family alkylhydroperoxidase